MISLVKVEETHLVEKKESKAFWRNIRSTAKLSYVMFNWLFSFTAVFARLIKGTASSTLPTKINATPREIMEKPWLSFVTFFIVIMTMAESSESLTSNQEFAGSIPALPLF